MPDKPWQIVINHSLDNLYDALLQLFRYIKPNSIDLEIARLETFYLTFIIVWYLERWYESKEKGGVGWAGQNSLQFGS